MKKTLLFVFVMLFIAQMLSYSQNVTITNDEAYTADTSAMLDVYSITKGMLVPRLTSVQREAIHEPATGLLVFDTDVLSFFFFNGSSWTNLSHGNASNTWKISGNKLYISDDYKVGINQPEPLSTLEVKANSSASATDPLFKVINKDGDTVFAVYPDGVQISFDEATKGNIGGFAVSGRSATKGSRDYLRVTTDSTRIYLNETVKGNIGGFAVSGRSATKGSYDEFLRVTPDSTRVYVNKTTKGNIGGFAVSGRSATKAGALEDILVTTPTNTTIFVDSAGTKGNIGGFAVSGRSATKSGKAKNFLDLTKHNYLIGQQAGDSITTGLYNSFLGYESGINTETGENNIFLGYRSGYNNTSGKCNVYIGNAAGYNGASLSRFNIMIGDSAGFYNNYPHNVFIGYKAGYYNSGGQRNVFLGYKSGEQNISGDYNTYVGQFAGNDNLSSNNTFLGYYAGGGNETGTENTFVGARAGEGSTGSGNIFIGNGAGRYHSGSDELFIENSDASSPLIYGDFLNNLVRVNGNLDVTGDLSIDDLTVDNITSDNIEIGEGHWIGRGSSLARIIFDGSADEIEILGDADIQVGIGTSYPSSTLDVNGNMEVEGNIDIDEDAYIGIGSSYERIVFDGSSGYIEMSGANVGINTNSPSSELDVNGDITTSGSIFLGNDIQINDDNYIGIGSSSERIVFDASGDIGFFNANVGIGTTTPDQELDVNGDIQLDDGLFFTGNYFNIYDGYNEKVIQSDYSSSIDGLTASYYTALHSAGNTGGSGPASIIASEGYPLIVTKGSNGIPYDTKLIYCNQQGEVYMPEVYYDATSSREVYINSDGQLGTLSSSKRYKKNIVNMEDIDWIYDLRPVNFVYKSDKSNSKQYGLVAEDVVNINPALVTYDKHGKVDAVTYSRMITPLIKAVQDQEKEIEQLKVEIENLKALINK